MLKLPIRLMTTTKKEVESNVAGYLHSNAQVQMVTDLLSFGSCLLWEGQPFRTPNISRVTEITGYSKEILNSLEIRQLRHIYSSHNVFRARPPFYFPMRS